MAAINLRGDWEFFCQTLDFPTVNGSPCMCWRCRASNDPASGLCWTGEGWRATNMSHNDYIAKLHAEGLPIPVLFLILTLVLEGCCVDVLHAVDQGISSHIIANVFVEVMLSMGANQKERVHNLELELRDWERRTESTSRLQGKLTYQRIKEASEWPLLKAKAATTRNLSRFALELSSLYNSKSVHDERRKALCLCLARFYEIIDREESHVMSQRALAELTHISRTLKSLYVALSEEALQNSVRAWKMTGKLHLVQHLCEQQAAEVGNPRFSWCYADEDLQKWMKTVALSCHPANVAHMTMWKWVTHVFAE